MDKWAILSTSSLFLIGAILLSACDSVEEDPDVLVPLTVGNSWTYETEWVGIVDSFTVTIQSVHDFQKDGRTVRAYAEVDQLNGEPGSSQRAWLYANGPEGYYLNGGIAASDTLLLSSLYLKYPARVGERWDAVSIEYRDWSTPPEFGVYDTLGISLIAKDEPFETPAGTFKCHVYRYTIRPSEDVVEHWNVYKYYVPGIGLVGEIVRGQMPGEPEDPDTKQETRLRSYRVM